MRIVVLTSETPANIWLVNQLLARHDVAGIAIERRPLALTASDKVERRRLMVQRYGLVITPEYRSADRIFWALYSGEPGKVGVTIHYIDRGIHTGPIIHQETVPVYADDSLATIYVRCIRKGAELYVRALAEAGGGGSVRNVVRSGVESRAFRSVDLGLAQYLLFRSGTSRHSSLAKTPRKDHRRGSHRYEDGEYRTPTAEIFASSAKVYGYGYRRTQTFGRRQGGLAA